MYLRCLLGYLDTMSEETSCNPLWGVYRGSYLAKPNMSLRCLLRYLDTVSEESSCNPLWGVYRGSYLAKPNVFQMPAQVSWHQDVSQMPSQGSCHRVQGILLSYLPEQASERHLMFLELATSLDTLQGITRGFLEHSVKIPEHASERHIIPLNVATMVDTSQGITRDYILPLSQMPARVSRYRVREVLL